MARRLSFIFHSGVLSIVDFGESSYLRITPEVQVRPTHSGNPLQHGSREQVRGADKGGVQVRSIHSGKLVCASLPHRYRHFALSLSLSFSQSVTV